MRRALADALGPVPDEAKLAKDAGIEARPSTLLVFGNPGTTELPIMHALVAAGADVIEPDLMVTHDGVLVARRVRGPG